MRLLLDENIPVDLAADLIGHNVDTVVGLGWAGIANGKLLSRASGRYEAFVTMDRSIEHEQNISRFPFGVLVLRAPSNRLVHLRPLVTRRGPSIAKRIRNPGGDALSNQ